MRRVALLIAGALFGHGVGAEQPNGRVGVLLEKPDSGLFVQVGERFMVPYKEKIPGSDVEFEMVPVAGGEFLLGSPPDEAGRNADEGPQIRVRVAPMWVGKYEVSQAEYREFEELFNVFVEIDSRRGSGDLNSPDAVTAPTALYERDYTYESGSGAEYPAVSMTQYAAQQYTKWISALTKKQYRLPTEAEWEYACRAGSQTAYSWGDRVALIKRYACCFPGTDHGYSPVGAREPNAWGLYDMHGNVGEWTVNAYTEDGYARWQDRQPVDAIDVVKWPETATSCVVRGGVWEFDAAELRSAARLESDDATWKEDDPNLPQSPYWFSSDPARGVGFRLFRSLDPLDEPSIRKFWNHMAPDVRQAVEDSVSGGRGQVGILDERLLPATVEYKKKQARWREQRLRRQEKIRNSRPELED